MNRKLIKLRIMLLQRFRFLIDRCNAFCLSAVRVIVRAKALTLPLCVINWKQSI